MLTKDYLIKQLTGLHLILKGDICCEKYTEEYLREKFENILSGKGIEFHELIRQAMEMGKLKLIASGWGEI